MLSKQNQSLPIHGLSVAVGFIGTKSTVVYYSACFGVIIIGTYLTSQHNVTVYHMTSLDYIISRRGRPITDKHLARNGW